MGFTQELLAEKADLHPVYVGNVERGCENISVDYAVLEKAPGVVAFAAGDIGWNDVGSWNAVSGKSKT